MNLKQSMKKAYIGTTLAKVEALLAEQSRWQRKETIARNKLIAIREKLNALAIDIANAELGIKEDA